MRCLPNFRSDLVPSAFPHRVERSAAVLPFGYAPDWGAVAALVRAAPSSAGATVRRGPGEVEREALVVAFAVFLSGDAPGRSTSVTRAATRQVATLCGLREERTRDCLALLARSGALRDPDGAPVATVAPARAWDDQLVARLADDVLRPAPAARVLRWDLVRERAGGSTRALAATAAFLDLLPVPTEWTSVSLAAVGAVARYTGRKIGEAVQRAVECGVVHERREPGSASLYRFAPDVLHTAQSATPATRAAPLRPSSRPPDPAPNAARGPHPAMASLTEARASEMQPVLGAATLMIGGIPFPLPAGARPELVQDAEGRYWYRVGAMHLGPVTFDRGEPDRA